MTKVYKHKNTGLYYQVSDGEVQWSYDAINWIESDYSCMQLSIYISQGLVRLVNVES